MTIEEKVGLIGGTLWMLVIGAACIGFFLNIFKLCNEDLNYKGVAVRAAGIFAFPAGAVIGYIDLESKKLSNENNK